MHTKLLAGALLALGAATTAAAAARPALTLDAVNAAGFAPLPASTARRMNPEIVKASVLLDRAAFSPGAIDGLDGDNFHKALRGYQGRMGLAATGKLDAPTWAKLTLDAAPAVDRYRITAEDAKGPFIDRVPPKLEDQASLAHLGYRNIREALGERFHAGLALLGALNPGSKFNAGDEIAVPAVAGQKPGAKAARIVVDKPGRAVAVFGADNTLLAFFPASIGSEEKPAPSGQFVIRRIVHNPDYTYDPKYHFKGVKADKPFTVAAGPNNPVGALWLDLSYEGYGIHGTPDPESIGKTQSHGCVRLTNWDAERLAAMVDKGVPVVFEDEAGGPAAALPRGTGSAVPPSVLRPDEGKATP